MRFRGIVLSTAAAAVTAVGVVAAVMPAGSSAQPAPAAAAADAASDAQFVSGGRPNFRVPFECGETWEGGTRGNHSPARSIDFNHYPGDDEGWKVTASAAGTVKTVRNLGDRSYGQYIVISHSGGYETLYAHLSAQNVREGQQVNVGDMIGRVGNTGGSQGSHLHYEQKVGGSTVPAVFYGNEDAFYWGKRNYQVKCDGATPPAQPPAPTPPPADGVHNFPAKADLDGREGPDLNAKTLKVNAYAAGQNVPVVCQAEGGEAYGSRIWDKTADGFFVADKYVKTGADGWAAGVRRCEAKDMPAPPPQPAPAPAPAPADPPAPVEGTWSEQPAEPEATFSAPPPMPADAVQPIPPTEGTWSENPSASETPAPGASAGIEVPPPPPTAPAPPPVTSAESSPAAPAPATEPAPTTEPAPAAEKGPMGFLVIANLHARTAPSLDAPIAERYLYKTGTAVKVQCQVEGGEAYQSKIWNKTTEGYYVSDAYVLTGVITFLIDLPKCKK
ncbi:M23 family metallopeptidase [Nakamurella aerolata]|uniref:M23 family metallopeptidase n=1 Tax=Nakamurella aerolata TaxID=1656892 RepID=UPI001BB257F6|nr:M23 family metallopeptidase [Nakamurella aerolata]